MKKLKKLKRRIQYAFVDKTFWKQNHLSWAIDKCYEDMFSAAGGDFKELIANATTNERGEKEIPFMDYEITKREYNSVLNFYKSLIRDEYYKRMFSVTINLGCSPRIKQ